MTISSGSLIVPSDYNDMQSSIANVLGTGSGTYGYGQTVTSEQVSSGSSISDEAPPNAFQWAALYNDMAKIAAHQGTGISSLTTVATDNVVPGKVIQANDINLYKTTADTLVANALNYASGDMTTTTQISSTRSTVWGSPANPVITHAFTVSFASLNEFRYFFNTGGAIIFNASLTGNSPTAQNSDWATMLSNAGTIIFNYENTTSSTPGAGTVIGAYDLDVTEKIIFSTGGGSSTPYISNQWQITASLNGPVITFTITFTDNYVDSNTDYVNGTLTSIISMRKAGATVLTINAPVFTNTLLLSTNSASQINVAYPSTSINTVPFTYTISNGIPDETYYITTNAPNHLGPTSTLSLNGAGIASVSGNDFYPDTGTITVTFHFSQSGTVTRTIVASVVSAQLQVSYPSTAVGGTPFTYTITNGVGGETYYITTNAATHLRIPASGTLSLNGAGEALVTNNDFAPDSGIITVTFHFSQSGTVVRNINVAPAPIPILVSYPSAATNGSPFTYTINNGVPGETFYITYYPNNIPTSTTLTLNGAGALLVSGNDFSPNTGTIVATFNFSQSGTVVKTITVSAVPIQIDYPQSAINRTPFTYTVSNGIHNDTYYITTNAPNHSRIPTLGTYALDASGNASVSDNDFTPDTGIFVVTFRFTLSGNIQKSINVSRTPISVSFPDSSVNGTPFSWSISNGVPGETWYVETTAPSYLRIPASNTYTLDAAGTASYTGWDFTPDTGQITLTFHFSQSGIVTKTISVTQPEFLYIDYLIVGAGAGGSQGIQYNTDEPGYWQVRENVWDGNGDAVYDWVAGGTSAVEKGALGFGGGGGRVIVGSANTNSLNLSKPYRIDVGFGGKGGGTSGSIIGTDGGNSYFLEYTAPGGRASFSNNSAIGNLGIGATYSSFALPAAVPFGGGDAGPWSRFMRGCNTWAGGDPWDVTQSVYFPHTGDYDIIGSVDDWGYLSIDGDQHNLAGFTSWNVATVYVTKGNHSVRTYLSNSGGYVTGIAFTITSRGQQFDHSGSLITYGQDGLDGLNGTSGASGQNGTGQGGHGQGGFWYDGAPAGNGGHGRVAIKYPGNIVRFNGGNITTSNGFVHHVFEPGQHSLTPLNYRFIIDEQSVSLPDVYGFGSCAGVGYTGTYLNISKTAGIRIYIATVYNYYRQYTINSWFYIGPYSTLDLNSDGRFAINDGTSYTFDNIARPGANGFGQGDWTALRVTIKASSNDWFDGTCPITLTIARDCKGGGWGWGENAIANFRLAYSR